MEMSLHLSPAVRAPFEFARLVRAPQPGRAVEMLPLISL
jgi:hypothetical protein